MRYKDPDTEAAREIAFPLRKDWLRPHGSPDFRFASAVAAFGLLLRDSEYKGLANWADVKDWAKSGLGHDRRGYRADFVELVGRVERLTGKAD
jgi:Ca-activated chloride channel family protein